MMWLLTQLEKIIFLLPWSWFRPWGKAFGWFYMNIIRYRKKDVEEALKRSFPGKTHNEIEAIMQEMYRNFGLNTVEMFQLLSKGIKSFDYQYSIAGEDYLREALKRGKGVLILSAHIGNWELGAAIMAKHKYPIDLIVKAIKNKHLNDFITTKRRAFGVNVIFRKGAVRKILRSLQAQHLVTFVLDQNTIQREGVFVKFFGKYACTSPGLAQLSTRSQAPVIPAYMIRNKEGKHKLQFLPHIEPPSDKQLDSILVATQHYTTILEEIIRKYPEQWIWVHRRWRTEPDKDIYSSNLHGSSSSDTLSTV